MYGINPPLDRFKNRQKVTVHQDHVIFGMIDGIEDLVRGEAHVDGMQNGADHRYCEEALKVTMTVPIHNRHRVARFNSQLRQRIGKATDPFAQGPIIKTQLITIDNLLVGIIDHRVGKQVFNQ